MMKYVLLFLLGLSPLAGEAQNQLVSYQPLDTTSATFLNFFANGQAVYDVGNYKIRYTTQEVDGTSTTASALVSLPVAVTCDSLSLALYAHGTVLKDDNVPSRNNTEATIGKIAASTGHAAVMPDYLGLGDEPGLHPYLHGESEATASLDALRAANELVDSLALGFSLQKELLVTGYSQGGHAAMATVKYIQENNLGNEFALAGAAPASGPYDLAGVSTEDIIRNKAYSNPGYVVYLIMGIQEAYGNIYNSPSDFLQAPYDTLVPPYLNGSYPLDSLNAQLPSRAEQFLDSAFFQAFRQDSANQTTPLWQALVANNNYEWVPNFPLRMYYCTNDEQVPYQNSLTAEQYMRSQGAPDVLALNKGALNHSGCVLPSMTSALSFFDSLSTSCTRIGVTEEELALPLRLFPNPASEVLQLEGLQDGRDYHLKIYDGAGRKVWQTAVTSRDQLALPPLAEGLYYLHLREKGARAVARRKLYIR